MKSEGLETTNGREGFSVDDGELTAGNKSHRRQEAKSHMQRNVDCVPWTFFSLEIIFNQNLHHIIKFIKSQVRADIRLIICASQGSSVICLVTIASLSRALNAESPDQVMTTSSHREPKPAAALLSRASHHGITRSKELPKP